MFELVRLTFEKWVAGVAAVNYWWNFGLVDVLLRYRRTFLGPIWITLTFAISASGLGFVYSTLFSTATSDYIPYLITGLATWMYISGLVIEGCTSITRHSGLINDQNIPLFAHALRTVISSLVVYLHNCIVIALVVIIFISPSSPVFLLSFIGVVLITLNGIWVTMLLGVICTRFRDLAPLISTVVNLMFLVTPVFWYRDMLKDRVVIADANPFYHLIEVVRAPILGEFPAITSYIFCTSSIFVGFLITMFVSARMEKRVPFWI